MTIIRQLTTDDIPEVLEVVQSRDHVVGNPYPLEHDKVGPFYTNEKIYGGSHEVLGLFDDNGKLDAFVVIRYFNLPSIRADDPAQYENAAYVFINWTRKRLGRIKTFDGLFDKNNTMLLIAMLKRFEEKGYYSHWVLVSADHYKAHGVDNQEYLIGGRDKYVRRDFYIPSGEFAKDPHAQFINTYILGRAPASMNMEARVASLKPEFRDENGILIPQPEPRTIVQVLEPEVIVTP